MRECRSPLAAAAQKCIHDQLSTYYLLCFIGSALLLQLDGRCDEKQCLEANCDTQIYSLTLALCVPVQLMDGWLATTVQWWMVVIN